MIGSVDAEVDRTDAETALAIAAELALARGTRMVEPAAGELAAAERGLDHDRWFTALVELRRTGLIQLASAEPSQVVLVALTNAGLVRHIEATRPDLTRVRHAVAQAAAAAAGQGAVPLADQLHEPPLLVEYLLDELVNQRRLTYSTAPGRRFRIHKVVRATPGTEPESP
jgi:hypothetical protein